LAAGFEKNKSGLRYQFIKEKVKKQKMVKQFLYIILTTSCGKVFDVHIKKKPIEFPLGQV
jgi:FKBP-type peptidyl-prolyl cis-trans isomerase